MSNLSSEEWNSSLPSTSSNKLSLREFSLAEMLKATNNFDESLLLRRGWTIEVYKGTYQDYDGKSRTVAIKCLNLHSKIQKEWFEQELEVWSQYCRHKNLVKVIGFCRELDYNIVVYEHMNNGSLAQNLCKNISPSSFSLSWEHCLNICIEAARGLEYIHTHFRYSDESAPYLGDVAAVNILLDENGAAKISDLYYEPISGPHYESAGFMDPESHPNGIVSQSSDVYAFGVLLVKVLSRRVSFDKEDRNLGIWINQCIMNGTIHDKIIHPAMKAEILPDCLKDLVDIVAECLNNESTKRPSIAQVVKKLELLLPLSSHRSFDCYSLHEIEVVTKNFESIIGKGGEGTVYKGVTKMNTSIAVKCLKSDFSSEFEKEIKMLSHLNHPNLVSLIGYCDKSNQKILIYEFMVNGNLAQRLYSTTNSLSWMQRLNICIGAARGLRYLHTRTSISPKGIIHRDVKPVNILLDENLNAKISDFGLSKMGTQCQENSEIVTGIKGTIGYYAPEYLRYRKITRKIDVFAYGVVLSEILCKNKPWDRKESYYDLKGNEKYAQWALEDIDPVLKGKIAPYCLELFLNIMVKCLNNIPDKRPSMIEVVGVLEYAVKWQEAWQKYKNGEDFCLPCSEDKVILYCSLRSEMSINPRMIFRIFLPTIVEERDVANNLCAIELKHALGNTADINTPHLFIHGEYIEHDIDITKLKELFGELAYEFNCDTCQQARACGICKHIEWYVHCKNCGALTVVSRRWEGHLRACFECNANQLICNSFPFTYLNKPK